MKRERSKRWTVPREWVGQTAVIIGGGPSLRTEDISYVIAKGWRRIVCNNAYLLDAEADVLVWGDRRWYEWNGKDLHLHTGQYKITWQPVNPVGNYKFQTLRYADQNPSLRQLLEELRRTEDKKAVKRLTEMALKFSSSLLSEDPSMVAATNTGQGAINVAYHFGAKRIILLGFDMQQVMVKGELRHNWHQLHKRETAATRYQEVFAPAIQAVNTILSSKEVELINCTPGSRLRGVPIRPLEEL